MKSFTCHNILRYCLVVLVCFFLNALLGCEEKVTPPAKPSVVKKRIEQDKTEKVAEVAVAEEAKKASDPVSIGPQDTALQPHVDPLHESGPKPGIDKPVLKTETEATETLPDEKMMTTLDEKVVAVADEKDQPKPENTPVVASEESMATKKGAEDKTSSLIASIPDESWQYDPKGKIDPFAALFKEDGDTRHKKKDKLTRPLTPLEKIDLSQLKLVAVIRTDRTSRAMVEDAAGKGYVLSIGTRIGTHSGKVVKILKDRVAIEEEKEDFLGRTKKAERELRLQKPSGEE